MATDTRFSHIRGSSGHPIATLASRPSGHGWHRFNLARCNPADQFTKKVGRHISGGRLNKSPVATLHLEACARDVLEALFRGETVLVPSAKAKDMVEAVKVACNSMEALR